MVGDPRMNPGISTHLVHTLVCDSGVILGHVHCK